MTELIVQDQNLVDIATTIANKRVGLRWNNKEEFYTDGTDIYLAKALKPKPKQLQGLLAHEAGHIGYGTFTISMDELYNALSGESVYTRNRTIYDYIFKIANVVEDTRIDEINRTEYPGFWRGLDNYITESILPKFDAKTKDMDILAHISLCFKDYRDEKPTVISNKDWKQIKAIKKLILTQLSTASSIIAIKKLYEILKKYIPDEDKKKSEPIPTFLGDTDAHKIDNYIQYNKDDKLTILKHLNREMLEMLLKMKGPIDVIKINAELDEDVEGIEMEVNVKGEMDAELEVEENEKEDVSDLLKKLKKSKDILDEKKAESKAKKGAKGKKKYITNEYKIETERYNTLSLTAKMIRSKYTHMLRSLRAQFGELKNKAGLNSYQKSGRINSKLTRVYTSNFSFDRAFTKRIRDEKLRILLMVDISGSMRSGEKLKTAKTALVLFSEALKDIAEYKIVLFTARDGKAQNHIVKDWDEEITDKKLDKFGCARRGGNNLDGVSIRHEAEKLNQDDIIIVISDGRPAGSGYGVENAIPDIKWVSRRFKICAFSIDAKGKYLTQMYGNNWILTRSSEEGDLANKLTSFTRKLIRTVKHK